MVLKIEFTENYNANRKWEKTDIAHVQWLLVVNIKS